MIQFIGQGLYALVHVCIYSTGIRVLSEKHDKKENDNNKNKIKMGCIVRISAARVLLLSVVRIQRLLKRRRKIIRYLDVF